MESVSFLSIFIFCTYWAHNNYCQFHYYGFNWLYYWFVFLSPGVWFSMQWCVAGYRLVMTARSERWQPESFTSRDLSLTVSWLIYHVIMGYSNTSLVLRPIPNVAYPMMDVEWAIISVSLFNDCHHCVLKLQSAECFSRQCSTSM